MKFIKSPHVFFILVILISLFILNIKYPLVGSDYGYFIPKLLDSHLFYQKNGLGIQWWTPSFGGGLPSYPNPQQIQFSMPQFLLFFSDPWISINLSIIIITGIGFYSSFFLLKRLNFHKEEATFGAVLFSTTGFFIQHLSAGHLGFLVFPLLPLILLLLINEKLPLLIASAGIGLIFTFILHSAGFFLIVVFFLSVPTSIILIRLLSGKIKPDFPRLFYVSSIGLFMGILISLSKLTAVLSFMRYFPRYIEDTYKSGFFEATSGFFCQLFITPIAALFKNFNITEFFQNLIGTESGLGLWEFDTGLSPAVLIILLLYIFLNARPKFPVLKIKSFQKTIQYFILFILCWASFELTIAKGFLYKMMKIIPFMKSLHVNIRFASVFIFPIIILTLYLYKKVNKRLTKHFSKLNLSLTLSIVALIFFTQYANVISDHGYVVHNSKQYKNIWKSISRSPGSFEVKYILPVRDSLVFYTRSSNLYIIEPIFGYKLQNFKPEVTMGSVRHINNNFYNITNPASLVFPEENNLKKFQRISVSDEKNLKKFITYNKPEWKISKIQKISNRISNYSLIIIALMLIFFLTRYSNRKRKNQVKKRIP